MRRLTDEEIAERDARPENRLRRQMQRAVAALVVAAIASIAANGYAVYRAGRELGACEAKLREVGR